MNIDEMTIGQAREIAQLFGGHTAKDAHPYAAMIGKNIMIRTVTMIYVGRLEAVYPKELVLVDASWIPETGRWQQFVCDGFIKECEPYPDGQPVVVGRGAIVDATSWETPLPREQK